MSLKWDMGSKNLSTRRRKLYYTFTAALHNQSLLRTGFQSASIAYFECHPRKVIAVRRCRCSIIVFAVPQQFREFSALAVA